MQAVGIVAEYNPFHNGHQYHIAQTKQQLSDPDGVIAVMSGNFTQRGEPAIFDKWTRTQTALYGGADLVLELPTAFATRSAGYFARGAVLTLSATGIISHLSCGVEETTTNHTLAYLQQIATILTNEPEAYRTSLNQYLKEGFSYPSARQAALEQYGVQSASLMASPNNILALEYLLTIAQEHLDITPVGIARAGQYHDPLIPEDTKQFASATAVRKLILQKDRVWQTQMPNTCAEVLNEAIQNNLEFMDMERFSQILFFLLKRTSPKELQSLIEITEGLEHRIYDAAHNESVSSIADLCMSIKSKRFTYSRIQRTLLHILLNFTEAYETKEPAYIRVLGFNDNGQKLLKEMKRTAQLPIIIRPARQRNELSAIGQRLLDLDVRATNLYYTGYTNPQMRKTGLDLVRMPVKVSTHQ